MQYSLHTDEKLEHGLGVQLEKALAKENDNKMKVKGDHKSKRAMQHVTLLHNHPAPTESTANIDNHSVEVKVSDLKLKKTSNQDLTSVF